jgi:hypothetical protein
MTEAKPTFPDLYFDPQDVLDRDREGVAQGGGSLSHEYGADTLLADWTNGAWANPQGGYSFARWQLKGVAPGTYQVSINYASLESRALDLYVDEVLVVPRAISDPTSNDFANGNGWKPPARKTVVVSIPIVLMNQNGSIKLQNSDKNVPWPHFHQMILRYIGPPS